MSTSLLATRETNRLIFPLRPVLVQVFLSLFDDWTKKLYTACDAPRNVCKGTSNQSVSMLKTTSKTAMSIDLRSHEFREQPNQNPRFKEVKGVPDVEIYPVRIAA
jgi:hypothetical protein